ncbi:hypothetical protein PRUPE_7G197200 [Prunus persica]|uniref:Uncharacterized protein n=1 Tax=Prunus persica TaxID=3760 RepID=A0A251NDZ3_PRUPE|nr:hypothetical protein PRUPE_7G197200 [Prunus persica]
MACMDPATPPPAATTSLHLLPETTQLLQLQPQPQSQPHQNAVALQSLSDRVSELGLDLGLSLRGGGAGKQSKPCAWGERGRILTAKDFPSMVGSAVPYSRGWLSHCCLAMVANRDKNEDEATGKHGLEENRDALKVLRAADEASRQ